MSFVEKDYPKGLIVEALKGWPNRNYRLIKAIRNEKLYKKKPFERDRKVRSIFEANYASSTNYKKILIPGQLVMFKYLKPKYKEDLEYYDAAPVTIFFGVKKTDDGPRMIGFNIHYYPPEIRFRVLDKIFELFKNIYLQSWEEPLVREISEFDYQEIMYLLQKAKLEFGIRMYIPELIRDMRALPPKAWSKAVFTEGNFMKKSRTAILNYWKIKMIDQDLLKKTAASQKKHVKKTKNKYG